MLLAKPRVDEPEVSFRGKDRPDWNDADSAGFDPVSSGEPDRCGVGDACCVLTEELLWFVVAHKIAEVEGANPFYRDDHLVSPMTTSGTTPSTVAGSGSVTWK